MNSTDEASVRGDGFVPDRGEGTGVHPAGCRGPQTPGPGQGLELGPPCSGEGEAEGGLPETEDLEINLEADLEEMEEGSVVLPGCEGRPNSPVDEKGDLDFVPLLAMESAAAMQELTDSEPGDARKYLFPDSCAAELSAIWANAEAGVNGRGALALSSSETQLDSAASLCHFSGLEGGQAWGHPRKHSRSRMMVNREGPRPSGFPEYSDVFNELQLMRVSIYPQEGGQAMSNSAKEPGATASSTSAYAWGNALHVPAPPLTFAPGGLTSARERQAFEHLEAGPYKKMQSVLWGKAGSRPSYLGATASAAASGGLPRASTRKKSIQEKKSLGEDSKVALGRTFPSWGQRIKADSLDPATFPPISGVPPLGMSKRYSSLPWEQNQPKHSGTGKRYTAMKTWESHSVVCEDSSLNRDVVPQAQLSMHRPGTPYLFMHPGEVRRDSNIKVSQPPESSQLLDRSQGGLMFRAPAPFGDLQSAVYPLVRERQQQPPGAFGCPWCVALQKERDDLKEQLAVIQSLTDKFQAL